MPEAQTIGKAVDTITSSLTQLAQLSGKLASELEGFADEVQHAQDSVRDLLRRLSPSNVLDTLGDFLFHGKSPLDEIKAVARDIKGVLDNHGQQIEPASPIWSVSGRRSMQPRTRSKTGYPKSFRPRHRSSTR